ncbi:MAG: ABC transporter substrate binding protein [Pseudolabrys sp.]
MRRREFIILGSAAAAWPRTALAQQPDRMRRIGVLIAVPETDAEQRWSAGDNVRTQTYAAELASLKPDVIFAQGTPVTMALKSATRSILIVFVNVTDPVSSGLVASLAQPGANITGFTNFEIFDGRKMARAVKGHCVISPQDCGYSQPRQHRHATVVQLYRVRSENI